MSKLLLIDGHNLLFQMFYGMPARIPGKDGRPIHGVVGFMGALIKVLEAVGPTHILTVFDGESGSDRNEILPDYKGNRPDFNGLPEEETPFSQLPGIRKCLDHIRIRHYETDGVEADDLIAAYAALAEETVILSNDADFYQLVSPTVFVYLYRGKKSVIMDEAAVTAKFGVPPRYIPDHKALSGDHSDNIKGVPGVGPVTAARLINAFGSMEEILRHAGEVTPLRLRDALTADAARLRQNRRLIELNRPAALPYTLDELRYAAPAVPHKTTRILSETGIK